MATTAEGQQEAEPAANAPTVSSAANNNASSAPAPAPDNLDAAEHSTPANLASDAEMTDAPPAEEPKQARSQPLAAFSSTTSNIPSKDAPNGAAAPTYGTRSRNRGAQSRVNYSEETPLDAELEAAVISKDEGQNPRKRKGASETHSRSNSVQPGQGASKRANAHATDTDSAAHDPPKEKTQIPGTMTFSINQPALAPAQLAKKRKMKADKESKDANGIHLTPTKNGNGTPIPRINQAAGKESAMLSFDSTGAHLKDGKITADDGTVLGINDHVYLVCEPPGEPYYLGRIMEFLHVDNDPEKAVDALRMNWYYRPRDIQRKSVDTRQIFASMHSDISPLTSLRGVCTIKHKAEIEEMNEFRLQQNHFWYDKLFDRYIHRYYEVVPTKQVVNVPRRVKEVLDDRWKYIIVETQRAKELTSAAKSCKRCNEFCTNASSVDCAICKRTYHMKCVRPPLAKKPSRGFGWQCGPCSRALSKKHEARNSPNVGEEGEELEEEDEDILCPDLEEDIGKAIPAEKASPIQPGTPEQIYQASLWPFRYLGIHCKVEDCLDYDDRIYPRAISRLGPKYQADVSPWAGRPVELIPRPEVKKKPGKPRKEGRLSKEALAAIEAEKIQKELRPKWQEDEPIGYVARGEDYDNEDPRCTAQLLFKPLETDDQRLFEARDQEIADFIEACKPIAKSLGLHYLSTNFLTETIITLHKHEYDAEAARAAMQMKTRLELGEPDLSPLELKKFEEAVAKYGSELLSVRRAVKTLKPATVVRFYYTWKKTESGKKIWGNFSGRKGKKEAKRASAGKLQDDVADDQDDSAFDNGKAIAKKKSFICKFCLTQKSRQWRRAPQTPPGTTANVDQHGKITTKEKNTSPMMVALCLSCAIVWRRYAVQWEDTDDKKLTGAMKYKRKAADDPMREFQLSELSWTASNTEAANTPSSTPAPETAPAPVTQDAPPVRKKLKLNFEKKEKEKEKHLEPKIELEAQVVVPEPSAPAPVVVKKKPAEKSAPPPRLPIAEPVLPPPKILPCAVCEQMEPMDQHVSCHQCRMTVHRSCYGKPDSRGADRWICDTCTNDRNAMAFCGYYQCSLCPIEVTQQDFVEPPKVSHKKKTEKDREREKQERELAEKAAEFYEQRQREAGRPLNPREPLKKTSHNNWVHVTCAVWTPEVKFANTSTLDTVEGTTAIPQTKHLETCKVCKKAKVGYCVPCHNCKAPLHVECAHQAGYTLGFDITPVKGSKKDHSNVVTIGKETGIMTAAIWCKEHVPTKTIVHQMYDVVEEDTGKTALQLYVETYKKADLSQTGAMRKAGTVNTVPALDAIAESPPLITSTNRRASTIAASNAVKAAAAKAEEKENSEPTKGVKGPCAKCGLKTSAHWYPLCASMNGKIDEQGLMRMTPPQQDGPKQVALAAAALNEGYANKWQCHKCHKNSMKAKDEPPPSPSRVMDIPAQVGAPISVQPVHPVPLEPNPVVIPSPIPTQLPAITQHAPPAPLHPQQPTPAWLSHPPPYSPSSGYANWGTNDRRGSGHLANGTYMPHHSPHISAGPPPVMESTPRGMNSVLNHAPHLGSPNNSRPMQLPVTAGVGVTYRPGSPSMHHGGGHAPPPPPPPPPPAHYSRAAGEFRSGSPYRPSSPPREMMRVEREMRHHMPAMHHQPPSHGYYPNPSYQPGRQLSAHMTNGGPPPMAREMQYAQRPSLAEEQRRQEERMRGYYARPPPPTMGHYEQLGPHERAERDMRQARERQERDMRDREMRDREMDLRERTDRDARERSQRQEQEVREGRLRDEQERREPVPRELTPRELAERDLRELRERREREREGREPRDVQMNGYPPHAPPQHQHVPPLPPPQPQQPQVNGVQQAPPRPPQGPDHRVNGGASASPSLRNLLS